MLLALNHQLLELSESRMDTARAYMRKSRRRRYTECVALIVVLGGHVLFVIIFLQAAKHGERREATEAPNRSVLILIAPLPATVPETASNRRSTRVPPATKRRSAILTTQPPREPPQPETSVPPLVDWHSEAERTARITAERATQNNNQQFDTRKALPSRPDKKPQQFDWNPEPSNAGFSGGLPYVRIGKRCVIGLGFFGCAIGDLPEANGHLLDGIRDPHQPDSSVPDAGE